MIDELIDWAERQDDDRLSDNDLLKFNEHLAKYAASACWTNRNHIIIRSLLLEVVRMRNFPLPSPTN